MSYFKNLLRITLVALLVLTGCKNDEGPQDSNEPNQAEMLVNYLESNGDYINTQPATVITAEEVRTGQLNGTKQIVLDLRTTCEYNTIGHIEGAVLISLREIPDYYKNNNLASYDKVIITCLTGHHSSYAAALLRLAGYNNVYYLLWGMSSWNKIFDVWSDFIGDSRAALFETATHQKNNSGSYPHFNTGQSTAENIMKARFDELASTGFDNVVISSETVFLSLNDYYIIDYNTIEDYSAGHIPNAIQYSPNKDFKSSMYLKTLPADKPVVVYCSSGQSSAHIAAYLKLIGYDVKSIYFGNNGMNYSTMTGKKFTPEEIKDYPFVK